MHHSCMRVPRRRGLTGRNGHFSPCHGRKVKGKEIIHTRGSIKSSKDVKVVCVRHSNVSVSGTWRRPRCRGRQHWTPSFLWKRKRMKVIDTRCTVIPSKDVQITIQYCRGMQGSFARRRPACFTPHYVHNRPSTVHIVGRRLECRLYWRRSRH